MNVLRPEYIFTIPTFEEFIQVRSDLVKKILSKKETIGLKWYPIIETKLKKIRLDDQQMLKIAIYLEFCWHYYDLLSKITNQGDNLERVLDKITNSISEKLKNRRSAIVRKVFNYETGCMEYELEDGNYIQIDEKVISPKVDFDNTIFPIEFVKLIDLESYRDMKIDEIL